MTPSSAPAHQRLSLAHLTLLDATPLELIDAAVAGGFDFIGPRIMAPAPTDARLPVVGDQHLVREIQRRLSDTGISVLDAETFWLWPETRVPDLLPVLDTAAQLGASYLVVAGNDPDASRLVATFASLCEAGRPRGLKAMLEFMPFTHTRTLAAARRVIQQAAQPNAGLLVDALHVARSGASPSDLRGLDSAVLDYWQICDAPAVPPADDDLRTEARTRRLYPGQGELPLAALLDTLPAAAPIAVEAPCEQYASLPPVERGRLCGHVTRTFLAGRAGSQT